jgi:hypothetical protein
MSSARFISGLYIYIVYVIILSLIYCFNQIPDEPLHFFGWLLLAPIWSFTIFESYRSCLAFSLFIYLLALFTWPETSPFSPVIFSVYTLLSFVVMVIFLANNFWLDFQEAYANFGACDLEENP